MRDTEFHRNERVIIPPGDFAIVVASASFAGDRQVLVRPMHEIAPQKWVAEESVSHA